LGVLVIVVAGITGWPGLAICAVASGIGLIPVLWGARRMNAMGILLLPNAISMVGGGNFVIRLFGTHVTSGGGWWGSEMSKQQRTLVINLAPLMPTYINSRYLSTGIRLTSQLDALSLLRKVCHGQDRPS
jgi:hypothetical protein